MRILVTAGNTQTPIDRVRCITNIFTGRTGASIALHAHERGHDVTLLTSHPEAVGELAQSTPSDRWSVQKYRTFDDLQQLMNAELTQGAYDALVHCAAVSDYRVAGVYKPDKETGRQGDKETEGISSSSCLCVSLSALPAEGKIKSDEDELWLRMIRTPKLVDLVRTVWRFRGILVKFKLEVDIADEQLLDIAERSRCQSAANLMVANTLEGAQTWAFLGPLNGSYQRISRRQLPQSLVDEVERLARMKNEE